MRITNRPNKTNRNFDWPPIIIVEVLRLKSASNSRLLRFHASYSVVLSIAWPVLDISFEVKWCCNQKQKAFVHRTTKRNGNNAHFDRAEVIFVTFQSRPSVLLTRQKLTPNQPSDRSQNGRRTNVRANKRSANERSNGSKFTDMQQNNGRHYNRPVAENLSINRAIRWMVARKEKNKLSGGKYIVTYRKQNVDANNQRIYFNEKEIRHEATNITPVKVRLLTAIWINCRSGNFLAVAAARFFQSLFTPDAYWQTVASFC